MNRGQEFGDRCNLDQQKSISGSVASISEVVQAAREVECPLYLGNTALSLLLSIERRGLGEYVDDKVIKFWDT